MNKKIDKKTVLIIVMMAVITALVVILATCTMFDQHTVEVKKTDWSKIVKDSTWTFSKKNVSDSTLLIPSLRDVVSLSISADNNLLIDCGLYSFSAGVVSFSLEYDRGTITVRQPDNDGYSTNNLTLVLSNQDDKKFDQNSFVLTVEVEGVGSLYFFKN